MKDLEEEYQAIALLAKSKRLFKKGTQRFNSAKATDQTECYKYGKKGHFARDCWSKTSVPSYQSHFQPKLLHSSEYKPESRHTKVFKAKYNKVKVKLALLNSRASALSSSCGKNKGLIAETYDWDEEEMPSDTMKTELDLLTMQHVNTKILKENHNLRNELKELTYITEAGLNSSNKVNQCISEQIPTQKKKILEIDQLTKDTSSFGPKDLVFVKSSANNLKVSITGNNKPKLPEAEDFTLSNHDTAPARGNKSFSASKTNSAPAGKLNNVKMKDDPPLAIVMKELNEIKLQISKNKSSYFRNKNFQQVPPNALQNKYNTQFKMNCELCGQKNHLSKNCYKYHTGQGESSSRSRPSRPAIPFPSYMHCGYNDHKSDDCNKPRNPQHVTKNYETCGTNVHTTSDHNDIEWFRKREALQAKKVESFKASKTESSSALRSKTPTKRWVSKQN
ncbi:retrovirus-related pol polyprotein from transposon TNT 1-94 [Tanacetum coccineum]